MKLGTQTGSVINNLHSRATIGQPTPVVGMGATLLGWTDRHPATLVEVTEFAGSKVWKWEVAVTEDDFKVTAGSQHDGSAAYDFTPATDGYREIFRFNRKTGEWVHGYNNRDTGRFCASRGKGLRIGERDKYHDPSF